MEKTVLLPGMWGEIDSDEIDEPQMSYAVATGHEGHRRVSFSGMTGPGDDLLEQARATLEHVAEALVDLGGGTDDVTEMRWYVLEDELSRERQAALHEVRAEFFERPHYPASTMVGVGSLLGDALVEIELVAEIPDDEWDVATIEAEDVADAE